MSMKKELIMQREKYKRLKSVNKYIFNVKNKLAQFLLFKKGFNVKQKFGFLNIKFKKRFTLMNMCGI